MPTTAAAVNRRRRRAVKGRGAKKFERRSTTMFHNGVPPNLRVD
jgi:hypothetical protein